MKRETDNSSVQVTYFDPYFLVINKTSIQKISMNREDPKDIIYQLKILYKPEILEL